MWRGFEGTDGRVTRVDTDKGGHDADCGGDRDRRGGRTPIGWQESGVERDKGGGILVGEDLQTSVPDIYACGDCASVRWFNGWVRPEQLWYTGRDQGRVAARAHTR